MISRRILASLLTATTLVVTAQSASITISFDSTGFILQNQLSVALAGGGDLINGNGAVLQLGYYSGSTPADPFLGTWIPLTGEGSANTASIPGYGINFNQTTIGDAATVDLPVADGEYFYSVTFDTTDATRNQNLPTVGTPLAVRFYNATTLAGSTFYNAISSTNTAWRWKTPLDGPPPVVTLQLGDTGQISESTAQGQSVSNELKTTLVLIPEPSSLAVVLAGMVGLAAARRRRTA